MEIRMEAARYLSIVKRWWWLLIVGTLMSVAAYGIASRIDRRRRRSSAPRRRCSCPTRRWHAGRRRRRNAAGASDRLVRSYVEMIKGPSVALRMIERLGLQSSVGDVQRSIDVTTPPGTQLIQVTTTARTTPDAQRLAAGASRRSSLKEEGRLPGATCQRRDTATGDAQSNPPHRAGRGGPGR
jgi:capsular polysaccharide biosynthesis protein